MPGLGYRAHMVELKLESDRIAGETRCLYVMPYVFLITHLLVPAAEQLSQGLLKKPEYKLTDVVDSDGIMRHTIEGSDSPTLDQVYEVAESRKAPFKKVSRRVPRS